MSSTSIHTKFMWCKMWCGGIFSDYPINHEPPLLPHQHNNNNNNINNWFITTELSQYIRQPLDQVGLWKVQVQVLVMLWK